MDIRVMSRAMGMIADHKTIAVVFRPAQGTMSFGMRFVASFKTSYLYGIFGI